MGARVGNTPAPRPWEASYPDEIDWYADLPVKPLPTLLDEATQAIPDNVCVRFRGRQYKYAEIADLVARAAKGFQDLGVRKGIKVGLMLPNCPYGVICFYAVLKAGGTVVNINPLYAEAEIKKEIQDAGIRLMVTLNVNTLYPKVAGRVDEGGLEKIIVCSMTGILPLHEKALFTLLRRRELAAVPEDDNHIGYDHLIDNKGDYDPVETDPDDEAVYQYTGGTTGTPKAATLSHANLYANVLQIEMWSPGVTHGQEKILGVLPLFHAFGMTAVMNLGLRLGAEIILMPNFKPSEVLEAIDKVKPTIFIGVPTMFSALNSRDDLDKYDLSSLVYCISGGAPLPLEVQKDFESISDCSLVEGYGLSETAPVCTVNPLRGQRKDGSVGLPLPGTVIEIVSLDDPNIRMPVGENGEICISGPQVMAGYADRAQETTNVLINGRLRTGDVGYLDEDGYLFIIDRIKELILSGGFNVYPRMVEEAICTHPAVNEAAVCGIPDTHRGEIIKAFVTLHEGQELKSGDLRAYLKDKLAPFQMPRRVEFRDELPHTFIGKLSKKDLVASEQPHQEDENGV
ncbi:MAG: long-chain fatty acid--CoA ligase [Rhodospirillales bacterium]|nr:long-chain fatty acid--CoA ligase [Rhodospirillales bacterium]